MAKITEGMRQDFNDKSQPFRDKIDALLKREKDLLAVINGDPSSVGIKKIMLCEDMLEVTSLYMAVNSVSVQILEAKNNDALNDARKTIYKAVIYLEEIVSNFIDVPYADLEDKLALIESISVEKRYNLASKLGLAIRLLMDAFGDNSKWKMSFVELQGRYAVVVKNMIDMKKASKDYFEYDSPDHETTMLYLRLVRKLLNQSAAQFRDKYELSTHRIDDMRCAINYAVAERRLCIAIGEKDDAEELKKKAVVWKERLENEQKKGLAR